MCISSDGGVPVSEPHPLKAKGINSKVADARIGRKVFLVDDLYCFDNDNHSRGIV